MVSQERRFLYQPSPLVSIINWSWTVIIFLLGVIFWLEITHFQWITLAFFLVFAFTCWAEIHFRNIVIQADTLIIKKLINQRGQKIKFAQISNVTTTKRRLGFVAKGKIYNFILPPNSVIELEMIIRNSNNESEVM